MARRFAAESTTPPLYIHHADIRPKGKPAPFLEWEVEQGSKHLRDDFNRDQMDPIKHSLRGRLPMMRCARSRIPAAMACTLVGVKVGATMRR